MKKIILIMLAISIIPIYGQDIKKSNENTKPASVYTSLSIGAIESLEFAIGKYLDDNFSVQVYWSTFAVEGGFLSMADGFGIGGSYYFYKSFIFNHITYGIQYYIISYKGSGMKLTVGNRCSMDKGINFIYELGIGYSDVKAILAPNPERKMLIGPVLKIGINYNF